MARLAKFMSGVQQQHIKKLRAAAYVAHRLINSITVATVFDYTQHICIQCRLGFNT